MLLRLRAYALTHVHPGGSPSSSDAGITWLEQKDYTLAQKAAEFEQVLVTRHDRHGMTSGCELPRFGATASTCISRDDDNNGLWTALVVVAGRNQFMVFPPRICSRTLAGCSAACDLLVMLTCALY